MWKKWPEGEDVEVSNENDENKSSTSSQNQPSSSFPMQSGILTTMKTQMASEQDMGPDGTSGQTRRIVRRKIITTNIVNLNDEKVSKTEVKLIEEGVNKDGTFKEVKTEAFQVDKEELDSPITRTRTIVRTGSLFGNQEDNIDYSRESKEAVIGRNLALKTLDFLNREQTDGSKHTEVSVA